MRAYVTSGGGADYHDQDTKHWINGKIATPMSRYPEYRAHRSLWGLDVLGSVVVVVEDETGTTGMGVSTGGHPAAWIIEHHLSRFVEGARVGQVDLVWDQMWRSTMYYGRKGLVVNAISAVDLALWDLWGRVWGEPVHALMGGAVRDELNFYATGADPVAAKRLGFVGAKTTMTRHASEGASAIDEELEELAGIRAAVGDDFPLALDCWMSLSHRDARRLLHGLGELDYAWMEEALPPEDYWGYAELRRARPDRTLVTTGEHEQGVLGFRMLLEMGGADIVQPDVGWCGGLTELRRIAALAAAHGVPVVPHGSSVYSYHFMATQQTSHPAEFLMMHPDANEVVPMFSPLLEGEPIPTKGRMRVDDRPGFGVELNPEVALDRPYAHADRSS